MKPSATHFCPVKIPRNIFFAINTSELSSSYRAATAHRIFLSVVTNRIACGVDGTDAEIDRLTLVLEPEDPDPAPGPPDKTK